MDATIQTSEPPIEELALIESYARLLKSSEIEWKDVAIFTDRDEKSTLILLLQEEKVVALLRFCLSIEESLSALKTLLGKKGDMYLGNYQGACFSSEDIVSLTVINGYWQKSSDQRASIDMKDVQIFFEAQHTQSKATGRGADFTKDTKRKVMLESHGLCMFEGCGEDLGFDELTGEHGNFGYLAHNVAASPSGPRGKQVLSKKLSNDPKNILLLCDKHHRLIDKVAAADYSADQLSLMKSNFKKDAKKLLTGLSYEPVPVYFVLWPVQRAPISPPSDLQVSQCLAKSKLRMSGTPRDISDNETILRETPEIVQQIMPTSINSAAREILTQVHSDRYKAGLFAFGLMPPLIALGAKIGNKNNINPMLRYRDGGQWAWPADKPKGRFYKVSGLDALGDNEQDVIVELALTANPNQFQTFAETSGNKIVTIQANDDCIGNGALGHPADGIKFMEEMQTLMHTLQDKHGVERIHLLPCASNAACVFFGKAFDSHHPEVIVYDFEGKEMKPKIVIYNDSNKSALRLP